MYLNSAGTIGLLQLMNESERETLKAKYGFKCYVFDPNSSKIY